ncbi:DUF559 domain-containing protein [Candidatus Gracilibacteria bacterium]|nr:DUF559 domain-containing protein [Candidatus Gracilibacteria bacterium]
MKEINSQIKFDEGFIKKLLDKLKIGNTRSIHLNAIPGRSATRLDLFQLSNIEENLPKNFIDLLLNNESFSFEISYDNIDLGKLTDIEKQGLSLITRKLNTIVIENNDNFLEFGIKNFGFGFPLLIKRDKADPTKIIKAPLFIWNLDIERSYQNKNTWFIKRDEDYSIKLNELLISHLAKDESIQLEKISKDVLDDGLLDEAELLDLCENILSQLNGKEENIQIKIEKCPEAKQIEDIANSKPWIQWSGIMGIYLSQKETIIQSTEELLENIHDFQNKTLVLEKFQTSTITSIDTDPSKDEILNTLTKNEIKLIQGPPGTGKSQSITAIISNALANGVKCLIVCEKKTALDVIEKNLEKAGLGKFSVLIDDVNKDRKKVIEKARDANDAIESISFSELEYKSNYKNYCNIKEDLTKKYSEPLKKIFGDFSWKHMIGLYLRFSKSSNFAQVKEKLSYDFLQFTHDEYTQYLNIIEEAGYLYEEVEEGSEINFRTFRKEIYNSKFSLTELNKIKENIRNHELKIAEIIIFLEKLNNNDITYTTYFDWHNNFLSNEEIEKEDLHSSVSYPIDIFGSLESPLSLSPRVHREVIVSIINNIDKISSLYKEGEQILGSKFYHVNNSKFFSKFYNVILLKSRINQIIEEIYQLFEIVISDILKVQDSDLYSVCLNKLRTKNIGKLYDLCLLFLGDANKNLSCLVKLINIEDKLLKYESELMVSIKESSILNTTVDSYYSKRNLNTLQNYYKDLSGKLNEVTSHLSSYESYHNWKHFELKRNKNELKVLNVLKTIPAKEWKDTFRAWYYRGVLLKYEEHSEAGFNKSDKKLQQLTELHQELKIQQLKQIKHLWNKKRINKISSFNHNFNALYNLRKNKSFGRRNSLRKIVETDLDLFTTLFPVILTNPSAVNSIFPLQQGLFEIVIFDEASQLRISDTFTCLIRGQYKIIAGDKHQMPPSSYFQSNSETLEEETENEDIFTEEDEQRILAESESLLQYAEDLNNINKSYLDYHYRSEHPALIEFSNYAFYGGNLIPFPPREVYKPIDFRAVNGRYDTRTNSAEIAEIVNIIRDELHPDQSGNYPSVGIATFNINQRNLIIETLNSIAESDELFAQKLQILREKGLFVKNLENIQGDERDIIIISTTYGIKSDGKFSQNFARLNRIEGYKLLNVLITRAKKKLFLCTSIPKEKYLSYNEIIQNEGNNKKGILYAYLAYAEAISNNDNLAAEIILRTLVNQSYETPRIISQNDGLSESPFEEEVYQDLLEHFNYTDIIQQYKVGGFRLDFVIKTKLNDIVLECDGKSYHQSDEAHAHDIYRQKELEKMGFIIYRIWSTNWFQDKENEMQKLLQFIENLK